MVLSNIFAPFADHAPCFTLCDGMFSLEEYNTIFSDETMESQEALFIALRDPKVAALKCLEFLSKNNPDTTPSRLFVHDVPNRFTASIEGEISFGLFKVTQHYFLLLY